eukprot:Opistho-2@13169
MDARTLESQSRGTPDAGRTQPSAQPNMVALQQQQQQMQQLQQQQLAQQQLAQQQQGKQLPTAKPATSTLPKSSMNSFMPTSVIKHMSTQKKKEQQQQQQQQ